MSLVGHMQETMRRADISPRVLGELTKIHYTTIYLLMRDVGHNVSPLVESTLERTLSAIDKLVDDNVLPYTNASSKEKVEYIESILD